MELPLGLRGSQRAPGAGVRRRLAPLVQRDGRRRGRRRRRHEGRRVDYSQYR